MSDGIPDRVLVAAMIVTTIVRIGLVVGIIVLAILFLIQLIALVAALLGLNDATSVALSAGIAVHRLLALAALGLAAQFFACLSRIIGTVGRGDPFTPENPDRLHRMGRLALSAQLLAIPIALVSGWLEPEFTPGIRALFGLSLSGLTLPLTLFILARVFRHGTAIREDLEGTV